MNWIKHHKVLTVLIGFVLLIALGAIGNAVSPPKPGKPAATASSNSPTPSPTRTSIQPVTYSSVQEVVNALNRGGLQCAGGTSGTPVVKGATSEELCNFGSSSHALIDIFPRTHVVSSAEVLTNSVSTGTRQIWTVYGSNWWVQTDTTYYQRVQGILGGKVLAGPRRPQATPTPPPASCYPTTSSGNCYEPGQYCRNSDHGTYGVAGNGEKIICEDKNGWRWEPA